MPSTRRAYTSTAPPEGRAIPARSLLRLDAAKGGRLISLDQDPDAVQTARSRLAGLPATVVQINFRYAGQALEQLGIEKINGALLDLGVSSHQLDDAARGFSYRADAPLDMRMSQQGETAADLVNTESREELARILRDYGEEPLRMADRRKDRGGAGNCSYPDHPAAGRYRSKRDAPAERKKNKNPSRRTFQALRIAVNHELDALEGAWIPFSIILHRAAGCASSPSTPLRTGW